MSSSSEEKKVFKNIFEAASHVDSQQVSQKEYADEKQENEGEDELIQAFRKCKKMHEEIELDLGHAFRTNEITPSQLRSYLNRPQNFSAQEWNAVQSTRSSNRRLLQELLQQSESGAQLSRRQRSHKQAQDEIISQEREDLAVRKDESKNELNIEENFQPIIVKKKNKKSLSSITRRDWLNMH